MSGVNITVKIYEESSKDTLFFNGENFKGVSIKEYLVVQRGFRDIVCLVEGEYLDEKHFETETNKINYIRKVDIKPIGHFSKNEFHERIKYLPMIKDPAYLAPESLVKKIYNRGGDSNFEIGKMLKEDLPVSLPWYSLFASHIGIFGNTGSGKTNTLTKLYSTLFTQKINEIRGKSEFVLVDFNGEYTKGQLADEDDKKVVELSTKDDTGDHLTILPSDFWDSETLCILFKATSNTQTPFLNRLISGRERFEGDLSSLLNYTKSMFYGSFVTVSPKKESVELLRGITRILGANTLSQILGNLQWDANSKFRYVDGHTQYFNGDDTAYNSIFRATVWRQLLCPVWRQLPCPV